MTISLISQILDQNNYVQQLPIDRGPSPLLKAYKRIKQLAGQLSRSSPQTSCYCVASTILAICAETEVDQIWHSYYQSGWDSQSRIRYTLAFERLQYQTNLAVSMLS